MRIVAFALALLAFSPPACLRWPGPPEVFQLTSEGARTRWETINFLNPGEVTWKDGTLALGRGDQLTGVVWEGAVPFRDNYELQMEARRTAGFDFFCAITFPVGEDTVTFVPGGWSGGVTGLSSVDGLDASKNATNSFVPFQDNQWYALKVRVTPAAVEGFVDDRRVFSQSRAGHTLGMRHGEIGKTAPLGLSSYNSASEIRKIVWRRL